MSRSIGVILNRVASPAHARAAQPRLLRARLDAGAGQDPARSRRWRCPAGIWAWSRRPSIPDLAALPRPRLPSWSRRRLDLDRLQRLARRPACRCSGPTRGRCRPSASASRSRATARSPSPTRPCWTAGGARAPSCCRSRRWPTRRRTPAADAVYLPGGYPELHAGTLAGNSRFLAGPARRRRARRLRLRRVRRLHGARPGAGRSRRHEPRHGRAAARGDQLRRAAAASRLPADRAARAPARSAGRAPLSRPRVPLCARGRAQRRRRCSAPAARAASTRPAGLPQRPRRRARSCT